MPWELQTEVRHRNLPPSDPAAGRHLPAPSP